METIIYALPKLDISKSIKIDFQYDNYPSPKLIKYGFNSITNKLDLLTLMSNPHYKTGLEFDFDRNNNESIGEAKKAFGISHFDKNFAELWEILSLFNPITSDQTIVTSLNKTLIVNLVDVLQKKAHSNYKVDVTDQSNTNNIVTIIHKYSEIDLEENAAFHLIINELPMLFSSQKPGSNLILQIFNLQTQVMAELIYFLSSLYSNTYIIKPAISSELSDQKYLILIGLKDYTHFPVPEIKEKTYVISMGLKNIPNELDVLFQCINSDLNPKKYKRYQIIKKFLDSNVFEGASYQEMIQQQIENFNKWIETFSDLENIKNLLDEEINKSNTRCNSQLQLNKLLV